MVQQLEQVQQHAVHQLQEVGGDDVELVQEKDDQQLLEVGEDGVVVLDLVVDEDEVLVHVLNVGGEDVVVVQDLVEDELELVQVHDILQLKEEDVGGLVVYNLVVDEVEVLVEEVGEDVVVVQDLVKDELELEGEYGIHHLEEVEDDELVLLDLVVDEDEMLVNVLGVMDQWRLEVDVDEELAQQLELGKVWAQLQEEGVEEAQFLVSKEMVLMALKMELEVDVGEVMEKLDEEMLELGEVVRIDLQELMG